MGLFKDCGCGCGGKKQEQKFVISLMSALVFFIIANPDTFRLMRAILGSWVSGPNGCPTTAGLVLHTIVFMLVTWGMMNIKRESYAPYLPEETAVGPSPGPSPEKSVGPTPRMADIPAPLPNMEEEMFELGDSGMMFSSMDINTEIDLPGDIKKGKAVTCTCSDGRNAVITP